MCKLEQVLGERIIRWKVTKQDLKTVVGVEELSLQDEGRKKVEPELITP